MLTGRAGTAAPPAPALVCLCGSAAAPSSPSAGRTLVRCHAAALAAAGALATTGRRHRCAPANWRQRALAQGRPPAVARGAAASPGDGDPLVPQVELPPLPGDIEARLNTLQADFPLAYGEWDEPWELRDAEYRTLFFPRDCSSAYGELDQGCVARLLLGAAELGPEDAFVDVGSGLGKLVVTAAALTRVGTAWGVELSPSRHEKAVQGADQLLQLGALTLEERARVRLVQADCADSLPEEVLGATHLLLTMKRSHRSVRQLRAALRARPSVAARPRVIWSVAHSVPGCAGLTYRRRFEVAGFFMPAFQGPSCIGEPGYSKQFVIHEYTLRSADGAVAGPTESARGDAVPSTVA